MAGATTLAGRLTERFGQNIVGPIPELHRLSFTPESIAESTPGEIASIGLPTARAQTLHAYAVATKNGVFDFPVATTPDTILQTLQTIQGIGPWTANYIAMRALRLPDAFPTADLGLLKATGLTSAKALATRAERWRPWRAYATLHLWQLLS